MKTTALALETLAFFLQAGAILGAPTADRARCSNDACARPAEGGEHYCAICGLERELFLRDSRPSPQNRQLAR